MAGKTCSAKTGAEHEEIGSSMIGSSFVRTDDADDRVHGNRVLADGRYRMASELLTHRHLAVALSGAPYLPIWVFGSLLLFGAVCSSAHILEALKPAP